MQVLSRVEPVLGKPPPAILVLHNQIQRLVELTVETQGIVLLIRLSNPRHRPLDLQLQILAHALTNLRIARNLLLVGLLVAHRLRAQNVSSLGIPVESLALGFHRRSLVAYEHLIVPSLVAVTAVDTDIPGGGFAGLDLALPFGVGGGALLVVEVSGKGEGETLVQALLVEEVGLLEAGEVAGDERRAGNDGRGEDAVGFARCLGGDGRNVLGCC